jgi:hypoxanthine phosphoribosyltransferase
VHYAKRDIREVLISDGDIQKRVRELGRRISEDYAGRDLTAVCILRGGVMFFADLMRNIDIPMDIEFMGVSSYGAGAESSGNVRIKYDMEKDVHEKNILIVEDIIDTGYTLARLAEVLRSRRPRSMEICCLLDKKERRQADVSVKYTGFEIPDEFVVGYGLDYNSLYRNYNEIGVLKKEIYETG